jgi:hypothetical protein
MQKIRHGRAVLATEVSAEEAAGFRALCVRRDSNPNRELAAFIRAELAAGADPSTPQPEQPATWADVKRAFPTWPEWDRAQALAASTDRKDHS